MNINPIQLLGFAKQASDSFIRNSIPLNEAIMSLAEEHELNPMQIRRVAEYANHEVQGQLYKGADDKSFTFELADPDKVMQLIQSEPEHQKIASTDVVEAAYHRSSHRSEAIKLAAENMIDHSEDQMRDLRSCQIELTKVAQHIKAFYNELLSEQMALHHDIDDSMKKIAGMAKDHIILNDGYLSDLLKFACSHDPEFSTGWKRIFDGIKEDMMKLGAPVDKSLINDKLEIPNGTLEVINGEHTLAITLDTMKNKISDEDRISKRLRLMDTFGDAVVDQIRVLKTPQDMDESILEDTWRFSKEAEAGLDSFMEYLEKEAIGWKTKAAIGVPVTAAVLAGVLGAGGVAEGASRELHRPYNLRKKMKNLTGSNE